MLSSDYKKLCLMSQIKLCNWKVTEMSFTCIVQALPPLGILSSSLMYTVAQVIDTLNLAVCYGQLFVQHLGLPFFMEVWFIDIESIVTCSLIYSFLITTEKLGRSPDTRLLIMYCSIIQVPSLNSHRRTRLTISVIGNYNIYIEFLFVCLLVGWFVGWEHAWYFVHVPIFSAPLQC